MESSSLTIDSSSLADRASAYAKALYYSSCTMSGISETSAVAAEEDIRSNQSRWWLQGDDPNHPALNSVQHDAMAKSDGEASAVSGDIKSNETEDDSDDQGREEDSDSDSDWDAPIFARDDDMATSSLPFCSNALYFNRSSNNPLAASEAPHYKVSTSSTLLPTWLKMPIRSDAVLQCYSTHPHTFTGKPPLPRSTFVTHHITSESEADDSFHVSEMSQDESSTAVTSAHIKRGVKRIKLSIDEKVSLDETFQQARIDQAKKDLLSSLAETSSKSFSQSLKCLEDAARNKESSSDGQEIDGTWIMISPPDYPSCLGTNVDGDKLFTLGRMSFGMYEPASLICSIQQQFNTISSVKNKADIPQYVPSSLRKEVDVESGECSGRMKTYNIIASFTIDNQGGGRALRGIMTNYGYALPDPDESLSRRLSIWFTGGTIEPADEDVESIGAWKSVFGAKAAKDNSEDNPKARCLAQNILLGAVYEPIDEKGVIGFHLKRPIGGHGSAFCDIVYMDDDLRVMRGHSGSVYVFKRTGFD